MANPSPITSPVEPPRSDPMPRNREPRNARRTAVFSAFLISLSPDDRSTRESESDTCATLRPTPAFPESRPVSVVVPRVDVDARDAFGAEHLDVAPVVLDRQLEAEAVAAQVPHRGLLEVAGVVVVAPRPHHEEIPPDLVPPEPRLG